MSILSHRLFAVLALTFFGCGEDFQPSKAPATSRNAQDPVVADRAEEIEPGRQGAKSVPNSAKETNAEPEQQQELGPTSETEPDPDNQSTPDSDELDALGPAWVADELEPNESCDRGATLGAGDYEGLTLQDGNADWYRVTVCPTGRLRTRVEFFGLDGRVEEFFRDEAGLDLGGASLDGLEDGGVAEGGIDDGGRTYCIGYLLEGADVHYSLGIRFEGC